MLVLLWITLPMERVFPLFLCFDVFQSHFVWLVWHEFHLLCVCLCFWWTIIVVDGSRVVCVEGVPQVAGSMPSWLIIVYNNEWILSTTTQSSGQCHTSFSSISRFGESNLLLSNSNPILIYPWSRSQESQSMVLKLPGAINMTLIVIDVFYFTIESLIELSFTIRPNLYLTNDSSQCQLLLC